MAVEITDAAATRFKHLTRDDGKLPRIEITAGGCNGFDKRFSMDLPREDDMRITLPNGVIVLIDELSYLMLSNSKVDFRSGLSGSHFTIEIPEAASTCGCGTSFSL